MNFYLADIVFDRQTDVEDPAVAVDVGVVPVLAAGAVEGLRGLPDDVFVAGGELVAHAGRGHREKGGKYNGNGSHFCGRRDRKRRIWGRIEI